MPTQRQNQMPAQQKNQQRRRQNPDLYSARFSPPSSASARRAPASLPASRVSGIAAHTSKTASAPAAANPKKLTAFPNRSAITPATAVDNVAPIPAPNPNNPIVRL